jgi:hypothetical protein
MPMKQELREDMMKKDIWVWDKNRADWKKKEFKNMKNAIKD